MRPADSTSPVRRAGVVAAALALAQAPATAAAQPGSPDLYARVEERLNADPELAAALGRPAPEMAAIEWLLGEWEVEASVASSGDRPGERGSSVVSPVHGGIWLEIRDVYPDGVQDIGYLTFSPALRQWMSLSLDSYGNANIFTGARSDGDRLVFEGDALILGIPVRLRQTLTREGDDAYRVDNEERLDGAWKLLDSYRYTRRAS